MTLETQVLRFLELEVFAAELYRQHVRHVPKKLRPLMQEFCDVEDRHVERFRVLYADITGRSSSPRCLIPLWVARVAAYTLAPFGWKIIFRFECWVEKKAIEDYQAAMEWVTHPDVRRAIKAMLKDEELHAPYLETLRAFCRDEEHHIDEMRKIMDQKN